MSSRPPYPNRLNEVREMAKAFNDPIVTRLTESAFGYPGFMQCSGSVSEGKHHYGEMGLQQHTWEVITLCMRNADLVVSSAWLYPGAKIDKRVLFLAAVYHDVGKTHDYKVTGWSIDETRAVTWSATQHKRLINHLNRSAAIWVKHAAEVEGLDEKTTDAVLHCILSHHADYGSNIMPKTREAWMLHLCDNLSARVNDCDTLDLGVPFIPKPTS